jgi:glycosyltransferase involved in cell wall biosynthesis
MRLAFLDPILPGDYTPMTPSQRPLGGTQSAVCYLAIALAARGHDVSILNNSKTLGKWDGVNCVGLQNGYAAAILNSFDVIVSTAVIGRFLRNLRVRCPIVLWTQHDIDQLAPLHPLLDGSERYLWNRFVMVSNWQAERYATRFKIKRERLQVMCNAISPLFQSQARPQPCFFEAARPPVLIYSSTPFRGLEVLIRAFPLIHSLVPGCTARIYSSMAVYSAPDDPYKLLYDTCRRTDGVEYCGSISQADLSAAYAMADIFAYPSTFRETSCISLMEAMASGCMVVSNNFGALSETAAGFGHLCARAQGSSDGEFADAYARFLARIVHESFNDASHHRNRLDDQRKYALNNCVWSARAVEWEQFLSKIAREAPRTGSPGRNERCPCGSGDRFKRCCGEILRTGEYMNA